VLEHRLLDLLVSRQRVCMCIPTPGQYFRCHATCDNPYMGRSGAYRPVAPPWGGS
jgi:hypothetical protein